MSSRPGPELETLIGKAAFIRLAEAFGGTRLLVPTKITSGHAIAKAVGLDAARTLSERLAPDVIRVPLARDQRAMLYRGRGKSNAWIATRLGLTETGVDKLFKRLGDEAPAKGSDQLNLFPA